ncbi:hypothetical protein METBIDRAFT_121620 [Metschnikowia bicuspidata var. bicuspidata NRRL YB-4993]|uniref:Uncharacterized protein n=1 Tax=Metschnikowia bicuspidata var. bicuspidata NRRL YB-4993 TaxID=869754 RepID=A0A1A0HJS1_9ASCO|nr:hypothetical protein METBIDRAFT_121620 [Metschnikowia bicuspidata var. bicuspidata NRRL YB-4993]OBA24265.1 hypothetical protein METBIDRAFT_121620 [Metschnikowia bicuspidata var. bicuspidata NRRL YB-4993]
MLNLTYRPSSVFWTSSLHIYNRCLCPRLQRKTGLPLWLLIFLERAFLTTLAWIDVIC